MSLSKIFNNLKKKLLKNILNIFVYKKLIIFHISKFFYFELLLKTY